MAEAKHTPTDCGRVCFADRALVASPSSPQAVLTEGFDPIALLLLDGLSGCETYWSINNWYLRHRRQIMTLSPDAQQYIRDALIELQVTVADREARKAVH